MRQLPPRHRERHREPVIPTRAERDPLQSLQQRMDRLFDDVARRFDWPLPRFGLDRDVGWPSVELNENDQALVVTAELPGMDRKDVEVLYEGDALLLRGERRDVREDPDRSYSERYYGRFERRIPLDVEIDWEQVKAEFRDGVLTVTLPKTPQARAGGRRIPITGAQ